VTAIGTASDDAATQAMDAVPDLGALKPRQGIAIARMNRFTQKVQELGA